MARAYTCLERLVPLLLLCGSVAFFVNHAQAAEPQWIRVSSTHFSVLTDAGEKKGREVGLRLEQMRAVFGQLLMRSRLNMQPLDVIALKSDEEYSRIAPMVKGQPSTASGFFLPGEDRNYIVLNLFDDESWRAVVHEFAHLMLNYNYPPTQGWFDEGFAEYFSSLRLDNKQVQLGGDPELSASWKEDVLGNQTEVRNPPRLVTELLNAPVWLPIPGLFTMRHTSGYQEGTHHTLFYAESWMVMHYLLNKNKLSETGTYFDLVQNQKVPVEQAIQQAYGMSPAQFEQAVKDYFHSLTPLFQAQEAARSSTTSPGGQLRQAPTPVGPDDIGSSTQQVSDTDARALVAEMAARLAERREQALKELESLVSQPKTDSTVAHRALAWAHMERKEYGAAIEELGKASEIATNDPWVHYYLALVKYHAAQASGQEVRGLSNMMQDLRAVLDWDPDFAEAYSMLALARMEGGGINSAMESMRLAIQLSPRNESYLLRMAQIYMAGKKWDAATALLDHLKSSQDAQVAQGARKSLEDMPTLKKYGVLAQPGMEPSRPAETRSSAEKPAPQAQKQPEKNEESGEDQEDHPQEQRPAEPQPDRRAVQFLKGKLVSVDCTGAPAALLTIATGKRMLKLRTQDYKALLLIGADEFSCDWKDRPIAVNYKAGGKADGDLVSLELQ